MDTKLKADIAEAAVITELLKRGFKVLKPITKTNRRRMIRKYYNGNDFDFAIIHIPDLNIFYIMPVSVFNGYRSEISLVETKKRQRKPKSAEYRERWDLLSNGR